MYFAHTEEQEEFRLSLRRFFADRLPHAELPALLERDDIGASFWVPMAQQLGLQGMAIDEKRGGSGLGMVEIALVLEEAGRALVPEPLLSTLLGATVLELVNGGGTAGQALLAEVAQGDRVLAVAVTDDELDPVHAHVGSDGAWRLSGSKVRVVAGQLADTLLVVASTDSGPALFAVNTVVASVEPVRSMDLARPQATVVLSDALAEIVEGDRSITETLRLAGALMVAAEQVGGAGRCLEMAVEYAKVRMQFGRPIGSFQGVKHRCADMFVEYEAARTALMYAAWAWDDEADDSAVAVAMVKAAASDAYWGNARSCIQVLGGIGFTAEHPAQLHFKRAMVSAQLFGSADSHREFIVAHLVDGESVTA